MPTSNIGKLDRKELQEVTRLQKRMLQNFMNVPKDGVFVEYEGKKFIVFPGVFWPFEDSKALVRNFVVHSREKVLDVGTGSGILAIFSAYKGASKVVAVDINPAAVESVKVNANLHGFGGIIEARMSNLFEALRDDEKFDVVIANLPFRNKSAKSIPELTMWDTDFSVNKKFLSEIATYLEKTGRIYLSQANFGEVEKILELAHKAGFKAKRIGEHRISNEDPRVFSAFELSFD